MSSQVCTANDIFEINQKKEYTLTATYILETVLTDPLLNAQSAKLWQILFNEARFHPNLEVTMSYSELAKKLKKSLRTISRYINILLKADYLCLKHNYKSDGSQDCNTLYVRVPKSLIEKADSVKNRNEPKSQNKCLEAKEFNSSDKVTNKELDEDNNSLIFCPHDNTDIQLHDNTVIHINNITKENNNNNNVVSISNNNLKIDCKIENQIQLIAKLKKELADREQDLKSKNIKNTNHKDYYEIFESTQSIRTQLELANQYLIELKANYKKEKNNEQAGILTLTDGTYMLKKEGNRTLSKFTFKRLVRALKQYGYKSEKLIAIINEIVYEVRFGSLTTNNQTKEEMGIERSLNIALKLVREGRWSKPTVFKKLYKCVPVFNET